MSADASMPLVARRVERIAQDIHLIELVRPEGEALPAFTAGAHVTVRTPNGLQRKYSLCNAPEANEHYALAVKREAGGRGGSANLIDATRTGDVLQVSAPRNDFALAGTPASYLFIAGGIGITPIWSMIQHLRNTGGKPFRLVYLSRSPEATAFLDELSAPSLRGSVTFHHDFGDPERSLDLWDHLEKPRGAHVYCCGPRPLMEAVRDMTGHWSTAAVHFEDFGAGEVAHAVDDRPFDVRLARSGDVVHVPADRTILEALRDHGLMLPSSCESGTCGTCRTGLLAGDPDHRDLVLSPAEQRREIMVCVSRAKSPELSLDL